MKPISLSVDNGAMFVLCDDGKIYRRDGISGDWVAVATFVLSESAKAYRPSGKKKAKSVDA